jgi:hypothetical protein
MVKIHLTVQVHSVFDNIYAERDTTDIILLNAVWDFPDFSVRNHFWPQQTLIDPNPKL